MFQATAEPIYFPAEHRIDLALLGQRQYLVEFRAVVQTSARNVNMHGDDLESAMRSVLRQFAHLHFGVLLASRAPCVDRTAIICHGESPWTSRECRLYRLSGVQKGKHQCSCAFR